MFETRNKGHKEKMIRTFPSILMAVIYCKSNLVGANGNIDANDNKHVNKLALNNKKRILIPAIIIFSNI